MNKLLDTIMAEGIEDNRKSGARLSLLVMFFLLLGFIGATVATMCAAIFSKKKFNEGGVFGVFLGFTLAFSIVSAVPAIIAIKIITSVSKPETEGEYNLKYNDYNNKATTRLERLEFIYLQNKIKTTLPFLAVIVCCIALITTFVLHQQQLIENNVKNGLVTGIGVMGTIILLIAVYLTIKTVHSRTLKQQEEQKLHNDFSANISGATLLCEHSDNANKSHADFV